MNHEIFLNREKTGDLNAISGSFNGRSPSGRVTQDRIISFKIIMDVSATELFVDGGRTVMTSLFFPTEPLTVQLTFPITIIITFNIFYTRYVKHVNT